MDSISIWEIRHLLSLLNEHDCPICGGLRKKFESAVIELEAIEEANQKVSDEASGYGKC